jgi:predicted transposase/invertase (TIGR01784 family)
MLDYRIRGYRRFPQKAMHQVVVYLWPTRSPLVLQTTFSIPRTRHEFQVIRLWEQPSETFLADPGLLPFAVLSRTEDRAGMLRQVAQQIERLPDRRMQSNVTASTAILSGLLLDKRLIQQILRRELMQESVIYQEIRAEGLQEGRQEGRQEGLREGLLGAIELGLELKFGAEGLRLLPEIAKITDTDVLKAVQAGLKADIALADLPRIYRLDN